MKIEELRKRSLIDLKSLLKEKRLGLEELREAVMRNKHKNVSELGLIRKDIARITTLLKEGIKT